MLFLGKWVINFIFGAEFVSAYTALIILCLGHLVNVSMGSVAIILDMVGLESYTARGVMIAASISVLLNVILIPFWGAVGAAIATTTCLIIWNVLLSFLLYKKTGILSFVQLKRITHKLGHYY